MISANNKLIKHQTSDVIANISMVSIIIGLVFNILHSSIGHQNFILTHCCSIGHSFLCMAKIGAGIIITNSIPKCISLFQLCKEFRNFLNDKKISKMWLNESHQSFQIGRHIQMRYIC